MLLRTKAASLVTAGLAVAIPLTAGAESVTTLDEVIIRAGGNTLAERRQAPNAKFVFDRKQIERFGGRAVGDVIRCLPGVAFGGLPGASKDVLRLKPLLLSSSEDRNRRKLKFKADGSGDGQEIENENKDRDQHALLPAFSASAREVRSLS